MAIDLCVLGRVDYAATVQAMQDYTATRTPESRDLLWICEHDALYTQGIAGKTDHILRPGNIPVVATNRGGQVTFHGPGQVVAYPLIDLQRAGYFVKEYVYRIEEAVIRTLAHFGVTGHRVAGAPGIYVRLDDPFSHARLPDPTAGQPEIAFGKFREDSGRTFVPVGVQVNHLFVDGIDLGDLHDAAAESFQRGP